MIASREPFNFFPAGSYLTTTRGVQTSLDVMAGLALQISLKAVGFTYTTLEWL